MHDGATPRFSPAAVAVRAADCVNKVISRLPLHCHMADKPRPTSLTVHQQSKLLEVSFDDGVTFAIEFELMRVYSPSAEVQGHGPGQETLQTGKRDIELEALEPVGNYAVQPRFSDGHNTGIFSWDYLYFLGSQQDRLWQEYAERLQAAHADRDAPMVAKSGNACASH